MTKSSQSQIQEEPHLTLSGVGMFPLLQEEEKKLFILEIAKFLSSFCSEKNSNYPVGKLLKCNMLTNAKCTKSRDKSRCRIRLQNTEGLATPKRHDFSLAFHASSGRIAGQTIPLNDCHI